MQTTKVLLYFAVAAFALTTTFVACKDKQMEQLLAE